MRHQVREEDLAPLRLVISGIGEALSGPDEYCQTWSRVRKCLEIGLRRVLEHPSMTNPNRAKQTRFPEDIDGRLGGLNTMWVFAADALEVIGMNPGLNTSALRRALPPGNGNVFRTYILLQRLEKLRIVENRGTSQLPAWYLAGCDKLAVAESANNDA